MLVYGDQQDVIETSVMLARIRRRADKLDVAIPGMAWHESCIALFLSVARLLQGVADAEFEATAQDEISPAQTVMMAVLRDIARAVDRSWSSGFARQDAPGLSALAALDRDRLPVTLTIRRPEGYAFYALYPEQYLAAARDLPRAACVIGLRSIGTGLAALVAAASDAAFCCTLRPVGNVYAREVSIGPMLEAALVARRDGVFALVDEGPGQSGSSLGGVADCLETLGVPPDQIVFLPSHAGDLGPNALARHRRRWRDATRLTASFDQVFLSGGANDLPTWFADLTGPAIAPLRDISAGLWRGVSAAPSAPADPGREARKYLLTTARGTFLLKFVGLDDEAGAKLIRARKLYDAGFAPEPLALRYGFLAERWIETGRVADDAEIWPMVAPYLSFRATAFPADRPGASLIELVAMARYNLGAAIGPETGILFEPWPDDRLPELQRCVRPVYVDTRMQRWEWIAGASGVLKTDAVDHAQGHDLVGCQDIAWDVAGAIVELGACDTDCEALIKSVLRDRPEARDLTELMILCYIGFQLGWWSFTAEPASAGRRRDFYRAKIDALLRGVPDSGTPHRLDR